MNFTLKKILVLVMMSFLSYFINAYLLNSYLLYSNLQRRNSISFAENSAYAPLVAGLGAIPVTIFSTLLILLWVARYRVPGIVVGFVGVALGLMNHRSMSNGNDYDSFVLWIMAAVGWVALSILAYESYFARQDSLASPEASVS